MHSKIQNDIQELVSEQVISKEIASKIETYYLSKKVDSPNRLFTVFGVLGALLVGLGVILILAHNWDDFSRGTKTLLAFIPLAIGQCCVGFSIFKDKSTVWKEASGTFLFFAVGSCISLISQIYNIPGNVSSFLLTWIVLCTPLIYLLRSHALTILHIVFTTYYGVEYGYGFLSKSDTPWFYLLLIALVLPYYTHLLKYKLKTNFISIVNWLLPLSFIIVLGAFVKNADAWGVPIYILLFGAFYNLGKLPLYNTQKLRRNGWLILGALGTAYMLMLTSFEWFWKDLEREQLMYNCQEFYIAAILLLINVGVLVYAFRKKCINFYNVNHYVFALFTMIFFIGLVGQIFPLIFINILILVIALLTIKIGADTFHFGVLNYGLLIIAILITCRFFDTNISFVLRGILFLGMGIGFFLTNYIMFKKQKERQGKLK